MELSSIRLMAVAPGAPKRWSGGRFGCPRDTPRISKRKTRSSPPLSGGLCHGSACEPGGQLRPGCDSSDDIRNTLEPRSLEKAARNRGTKTARAKHRDARTAIQLFRLFSEMVEWSVTRGINVTGLPLGRTPHIEDMVYQPIRNTVSQFFHRNLLDNAQRAACVMPRKNATGQKP